MNKPQLLILLLIIALVFYYLSEEKHSFKQKPSFIGDQNQPKNDREELGALIKKPKPELTRPSDEPATITEPQPVNFGLNPPHSELNEPAIELKVTKETIPPPEPEFLTDDNSLNEIYRQRFLSLLTNLPLSLLTQQAANTLQVKNQPLSSYFQALWKLKGLPAFKEQIAQPLREWINLTTAIKPPNSPTDYGWLTDDNLEFILNNYQPIQSALNKTKSFHLRTDLANIYHSFQKALSQQEWDLPEFIQSLELNQYTLFPLRVSGNHWGLFILHNLTWQDLTPVYQVYYTSSGGMSLEEEKKQLQPFINQICGETEIQILPPVDRQSKGYECGVYLVFYLQEILEKGKLELTRTYSPATCQQFRWEWKERMGDKWCQI